MMGVSPTGSPTYVEALYARALLGVSEEDTRRDLARIVVEFSLSPRAEDALLRLAQLEIAHGDRALAKKHLDQLMLEHAAGAAHAQALYWMGRVLLEDGAPLQGCASLLDAGRAVDSLDVELANQIAYYARPCAGWQRTSDSARADSGVRARADSAGGRPAGHVDSAGRKAGREVPRTESRGGNGSDTTVRWSVQVAAYTTRDDAMQLAKRLGARGFEARVTTEKPYRVRIGRFARREDAVQLAVKLKAARTTADVVRAERP